MTTPEGQVPRPAPRGPLRRRDVAIIGGLAVVIVAFSAISITINAQRPDVPTTSNEATADPRVQDAAFVIALDAKLLPGRSQQEAIALGRGACASLAGGATRDEALALLAEHELSSNQASAVLTAAVGTYCPVYRTRLGG